MKRILIFFVAFLFTRAALCQYYVTGTDPGSIKWEQIKTPHFKVIYPLSFREHAQYTANGLEYYQKSAGITLKSHVIMIQVILHDRTTITSYVIPNAPFRIFLLFSGS